MNPEKDLTLPGLVHDLNNVFQTLVDAADLLADEPRLARVYAALVRSIERGQQITHALAGGGGGSSAAFETILANAIAFVEDSAMSANKRAAITFFCDVEPGIDLRHGWAWERVLINLFLNSRRAMPKGGAIHVHAGRQGSRIEITVRDTGTGIAPGILDRIFEPRVSGHGSSGLGLHIVRTIVSQDGGTITGSNLATGAEFVIALPLTAALPRRIPLARAAGD